GRREVPHVLGPVGIRAELLRADGRVVSWIEEQDHALSAMVRKLERPIGAFELEIRRAPADSGVAHALTLPHREIGADTTCTGGPAPLVPLRPFARVSGEVTG